MVDEVVARFGVNQYGMHAMALHQVIHYFREMLRLKINFEHRGGVRADRAVDQLTPVAELAREVFSQLSLELRRALAGFGLVVNVGMVAGEFLQRQGVSPPGRLRKAARFTFSEALDSVGCMRILFVLLMVAGPSAWAAVDLRAELQHAAAKQDPDFPDGKSLQLVRFAHVCDLSTKDGLVHVVDERIVMTGMLAPRGQHQIAFFDQNQKFLGKLHYVASMPLWCEGAKLYLFGSWDGSLPGQDYCAAENCNVVEMEGGKISLSHEKKYGSSGGVEDR